MRSFRGSEDIVGVVLLAGADLWLMVEWWFGDCFVCERVTEGGVVF